MPLKIAVIGSGISGLSAAWLLSRTHDVTVFEKDDRIGGHCNTVTVRAGRDDVPVDTGFIVYNEANYPNLTAMFGHLDVPTAHAEMTFAVSIDGGRNEYSGTDLNGLFGQRRNIVRMEHWRLVSDIWKFFRLAHRQVASVGADVSIGQFVTRFGYSRTFLEDHILPLSAAIWSTPARTMLDFPARTFVEFFSNHGLLRVLGRPTWRTVEGGARQYVRRLIADGSFAVRPGARIARVVRHAGGVELVHEDGSRERFDELVLACHADQALALLADANADERGILGAFRFTPNRAVLHTDPGFMPRRRRLWSAWNYLRAGDTGGLSVTYWMNQLQPLPTTEDLFVTLNPVTPFAPGSVRHDIVYEHPVFDARTLEAQRAMWRIQGARRTWFAGAWLGYGFHEDGLQAGLEVAERIGPAVRPWAIGIQRDRIAHNWPESEAVPWAAE